MIGNFPPELTVRTTDRHKWRKLCDFSEGKHVYLGLYIHRDLLPQLPIELQQAEQVARQLASPNTFELIKFRKDAIQISFLHYPDFWEMPHPELHRATTVNLETRTVKVRDYNNNRPILHRLEKFISPLHPRWQGLREFTQREIDLGFYQPPVPGLRRQWDAKIATLGYIIEDWSIKNR